MKILYTYSLLLLILASCHPNEDIIHTDNVYDPIVENSNLQRGVELPANTTNPYDAAGRLHNEIFEAYYSSTVLPSTLDSIAFLSESLGTNNAEFAALKGQSYIPVSTNSVTAIISNANTIEDVIENSSLSSQAQASLSDFTNDLIAMDVTEDDFEVIYNFVIIYEAGIIQNTQLTAGDKKIILTASSIARYSAYMKRKKPKQNTDGDWTVLIANIAGGIEGASSGTAEAIMKAFVCGAAENNL